MRNENVYCCTLHPLFYHKNVLFSEGLQYRTFETRILNNKKPMVLLKLSFSKFERSLKKENLFQVMKELYCIIYPWSKHVDSRDMRNKKAKLIKSNNYSRKAKFEGLELINSFIPFLGTA